MMRLAKTAAVLLPMAFLLTAVVLGEDEKTPTIKEVMRKLHKGANSPLATVKNQLKSDSPDWTTVEKKSKDFVILGAALAKNDPPRGDKTAYKKLADDYYENAKKLDDAAKNKDLAAARSAHKTLSDSCKACHAAHKGK